MPQTEVFRASERARRARPGGTSSTPGPIAGAPLLPIACASDTDRAAHIQPNRWRLQTQQGGEGAKWIPLNIIYLWSEFLDVVSTMLDIWSDLFGLAIFYGPVLSGKKRWEHAPSLSSGIRMAVADYCPVWLQRRSPPPPCRSVCTAGDGESWPLLTLFGSFDSGTVR